MTDRTPRYFDENGRAKAPTNFEQAYDYPHVIVAEDASEIQPAIDTLSDRRHEGSHVGGIVQLLPKAYYPSTTIWLKRGVILRGAREWPQSVSPTASKYGSGTVAETGVTTLYTSNLPEGPAWTIRPEDGGAHTYRHFNTSGDMSYYRDNDPDKDSNTQWWHDNTHPHLPVVAAYTKQPIYYNDPLTEEEKRYWGDGVGMMNLRIHADQTRYWDPANETDGSQREKQATYFGVYDGFIFEDLEFLHLSNIEVSGFDGYTAFYQDIQQVISRGNHYKGTATDHHGNALLLSHANTGTNRYMRGMWDLRVSGPTPTVEVDNHAVDTRFVTGANIKNIIEGQSCRFLGTESDYDNGNAPIVDPSNKHTVVVDADSIVHWDNYKIRSDSSTDKLSYDLGDSNTHLHNMDMGDVVVGGFNVNIRDSSIGNIECENTQPYITNCEIGSITMNSRADHTGGWYGCKISTDDNGYSMTGYTNQKLFMHNCHFSGDIEDPDMGGDVTIINPSGWANSGGGEVTFTSDGTTTSFTTPHNMDEEPVNVLAQPTNTASQSNWPVIWSLNDADGDGFSEEIQFTFDTAPSNDPTLNWIAIGTSHPMNRASLIST